MKKVLSWGIKGVRMCETGSRGRGGLKGVWEFRVYVFRCQASGPGPERARGNKRGCGYWRAHGCCVLVRSIHRCV